MKTLFKNIKIIEEGGTGTAGYLMAKPSHTQVNDLFFTYISYRKNGLLKCLFHCLSSVV
jgi:hypothetical protein